MGLKNDAKDVIGLLRGVNFIVLVWNIDSLSFPLDEKISQVLEKLQEDLSYLLELVSNISQLDLCPFLNRQLTKKRASL